MGHRELGPMTYETSVSLSHVVQTGRYGDIAFLLIKLISDFLSTQQLHLLQTPQIMYI